MQLHKLMSCEESAAARILQKESIKEHLVSICKQSSFEEKVAAKRTHQLPSIFDPFKSNFGHALDQIPHIQKSIEMTKPKQSQSPIVPKNPNAHLVRLQTGISITEGNYLNNFKSDQTPTWQKPTQPMNPSTNEHNHLNPF